MARYSIPECNMESLEKKLVKISNKCKKYGCEFKYERVGEHFEDHEFPKYNDFGEKVGKYTETVKFIDIEVDGKAVVNGWKFAASLEYTDKGNIVVGHGGLEIPSRYYDCAPWCEHCKTMRDRKYSYIVFNEESGEFKQVGKACLKDFTGGLSAEGVAMYESYFKEIEVAEDYSGWSGFGKSYFKTDEFMACVAEMIRIYGYVRSSDYYSGISTASRAEDAYRVENGMSLGMFAEEVKAMYDEAVAKGFDSKRKETAELVEKVRNWILSNERDDNYFHNLKVACALEYCDGRPTGLLASAFTAYDRELEREAEKRERELKAKAEGELSKHVGTVGKRISFKAVEVKALTSWETMYGVTVIYKFVDGDGNVFTWKTSGWVNTDREIAKVTGTVKEHKEYRGVKQTELTRCKIEYVEEKRVDEKEHAPANNEAREAFNKWMDDLDEAVI